MNLDTAELIILTLMAILTGIAAWTLW